MKVLNVEQMRALDRETVEHGYCSFIDLMENAGRAVFNAALSILESSDDPIVWVCAGKGNNGGDALAAARLLAEKKIRIHVLCPVSPDDITSSDAQEMARKLLAFEPEWTVVESEFSLTSLTPMDGDLIIDGLLGTGARGPVSGTLQTIIEWICRHDETSPFPIPILAVDLPSGLDADTGNRIGSFAVRADLTLTLGVPKPGLFLNEGPVLAGRIRVADIGIPDSLVQPFASNFQVIAPSDLGAPGFRRAVNSHKGSYGHVLVVGGSPGMLGAALLAAQAALRTGAGKVTLAVPAPLQPQAAARVTEIMTLALPCAADGALDETAADAVLDFRCEALVLGCGLGRGPRQTAFVRRLVEGRRVPMAIDADAIVALGLDPAWLRSGTQPVVLTPHPGEMAVLTGHPVETVQETRIAAATRVALSTGAAVCLKGHQTVVASPEGEAWINLTGNPGMATAGMGDVLAGMVGTLLAFDATETKGGQSIAAALQGVYLHGLAGDLVAARQGENGMIASDVVESIPQAIDHLVYSSLLNRARV